MAPRQHVKCFSTSTKVQVRPFHSGFSCDQPGAQLLQLLAARPSELAIGALELDAATGALTITTQLQGALQTEAAAHLRELAYTLGAAGDASGADVPIAQRRRVVRAEESAWVGAWHSAP